MVPGGCRLIRSGSQDRSPISTAPKNLGRGPFDCKETEARVFLACRVGVLGGGGIPPCLCFIQAFVLNQNHARRRRRPCEGGGFTATRNEFAAFGLDRLSNSRQKFLRISYPS